MYCVRSGNYTIFAKPPFFQIDGIDGNYHIVGLLLRDRALSNAIQPFEQGAMGEVRIGEKAIPRLQVGRIVCSRRLAPRAIWVMIGD
jgi:hypothetical protein